MSDYPVLFRSVRCGTGHTHTVFEHSRSIQQRVFVEEQGVQAESVFEQEHEATHYVCYAKIDDVWIPVACARVLGGRLRNPIKIGRVATHLEHRGNKYAYRLLEYIIAEQGERYQPTLFTLNAQIEAQGLYEALGFEPQGEMFDDEGIRHIRMELKWPLATAA